MALSLRTTSARYLSLATALFIAVHDCATLGQGFGEELRQNLLYQWRNRVADGNVSTASRLWEGRRVTERVDSSSLSNGNHTRLEGMYGPASRAGFAPGTQGSRVPVRYQPPTLRLRVGLTLFQAGVCFTNV